MRHATRATVILAAAIAAIAAAAPGTASPHRARPAREFLDSVGVNTSLPNRGQTLSGTIDMLRYAGIRWIREGPGDLSANGPVTMQTMVDIHRKAGVMISWGLLSGGSDVAKLVSTGRVLASAGALLAFEGANEPNNWPVTVDGVQGGGKSASWAPVAKLQARLYETVKSDPRLRRYSVWNVSEAGAEKDDVGLQYLRVPNGAKGVAVAGTRYADAANLHNYPTGVNDKTLGDDIAWSASDPTSSVKADGLHPEYGLTWGGHFPGYAQAELDALPRVSTETGALVQGAVDERRQGAIVLDIYLSQFARGFSHTSLYLLRDRTDEAGNQAFGLFRPDYSPRPSATWLHNLTTILTGAGARGRTDALDYDIEGRPAAVHDLLLRTAGGGLALVVWDERGAGEDRVTVRLTGRFDADVYDPTKGVQPADRRKAVGEVSLTLTDHPVIVMLEPAK